MYTGFTCAVRVHNDISSWFPILTGVQQGAPLSMLLYELYINDLLILLKNSDMGAKIECLNITCPSYADDVALIATSHGKMQHLLDIAHDYSKRWRYEFNAKKCEVVYFGKKIISIKMFHLGYESLNYVNGCIHLGTPLSPKLQYEDDFVKGKIY